MDTVYICKRSFKDSLTSINYRAGEILSENDFQKVSDLHKLNFFKDSKETKEKNLCSFVHEGGVYLKS